MFASLKVAELKKLLAKYRVEHTIKGYSKMKKQELVVEMEKRFELKNGELVVKGQIPEPVAAPLAVKAKKKRIQPMLVGPAAANPAGAFAAVKPDRSNASVRLENKTNELEEYYKNRPEEDEYPEFRFKGRPAKMGQGAFLRQPFGYPLTMR